VRINLTGGAQVAVASGQCADSVDLATGARVTVMVRPEHAILGNSADGLSVRVTDTVFQGSSMRIVGRLADNTEVVALAPIDPSQSTPIPGQECTITWQPASPYVLGGWPETAGSTSTNVDSIEAAL
jgi:ABC-type Fe3+/spermidine/putrescine transport system ATPase subunit